MQTKFYSRASLAPECLYKFQFYFIKPNIHCHFILRQFHMVEIQFQSCEIFFHCDEKHFNIDELSFHLSIQQFHLHAKRFHSNDLVSYTFSKNTFSMQFSLSESKIAKSFNDLANFENLSNFLILWSENSLLRFPLPSSKRIPSLDQANIKNNKNRPFFGIPKKPFDAFYFHLFQGLNSLTTL